MGRSTVHYADNKTNNALKKLHNKLRPAGTPVQRVEYIIELLLLRIFETKIKQDDEFKPLRKLFSTDYKWKNPKTGKEESNENRLFSYLPTVSNDQILSELNDNFFPFYSSVMTSARQVFEGNLPQKVQDQLVLIEEVFSNSNFTNNVNSGNLGEVISIVANDIEEARLLKTDLLGDAIESALSETGGTKDVGLFRTPDHIRQFMTGLIEPTFDDLIFDPACGTGGFLFDAFEFVMRRVDPSREWPGEKGHSELLDWFDNYFKKNQLDFPSIEQTTQFYRGGVTGIEYLGMIRKMAAINFYVRGLNPANIEQGDSLAKYSPVSDHESKSIILANPPFGAERDQEAYPEVWQEFSKESETTILFVKLMFEQLKVGGQCAVVVSEGFNTWDQFSAKALRKMLLDEAQLKAVISLPQGLFVSKSGQGPKTSILIFEKGGKTDWTWFYKVSNDGYSMGTNRKEQKGNQLVECLSLYHEYVKKGIKPPESKNQFCIPAQWIKTLDPRIKDKIRKETRADLAEKGKKERVKKETELNKKVKAKKISEEEKQKNLKTFDQMLENRIQNEIAKRIDKAHNYSFNLANYKSTLSESQITEWTAALKHIEPNGATTLDEVYKKLNSSKPQNALPYLLKLNPDNALEADIAREYVSNLDEIIVAEKEELHAINEVLKSKEIYPMDKLSAFLTPKSNKIVLDEDTLYKQVKIKLYGKGVLLRHKQFGSDIKTASQYIVNSGDFIISKIDARNGAFGIVPEELDNAVVTSSFPYFEVNSLINPKYLVYVITQPYFFKKIEDMVSGATGRRSVEVDDFLGMEIPIPTLEEQNIIVTQLEKQKAIIEGADKVIKNWEVDFQFPDSFELVKLKDVCEKIFTGNTPSGKVKGEGEIQFLKVNNLSFHLSINNDVQYFIDRDVLEHDMKNHICYPNDILMNIVGPPMGKVSIVPESLPQSTTNQNVICFRASNTLLPKYLGYFLLRTDTIDTLIEDKRGVVGQWFVNKTMCSNIEMPLPEIAIQEQIITKLDSQVAALEGLRKMKSEAEKKIEKILAGVWGVDEKEPTKTA
jgi:type I restriction-modification system DNA methylase subunit/restriction endonuclease S subunit